MPVAVARLQSLDVFADTVAQRTREAPQARGIQLSMTAPRTAEVPPGRRPQSTVEVPRIQCVDRVVDSPGSPDRRRGARRPRRLRRGTRPAGGLGGGRTGWSGRRCRRRSMRGGLRRYRKARGRPLPGLRGTRAPFILDRRGGARRPRRLRRGTRPAGCLGRGRAGRRWGPRWGTCWARMGPRLGWPPGGLRAVR